MLTPRPAEPGDYPTFARLFLELQTDEPAPPSDRFELMLPTTLVAERAGAAVGYALYEILGDICYVRNLVTDRAARRSGVGARLMAEIAGIARARGCTRWRLNVKPENVAAVTLYERLGFRGVREGRTVRLSWAAALALPGADVAEQIEPADDAAFETVFDAEPGLLASRRAKGSLVLGVRRGGAPLALACFDAKFPGGYPFRAPGLVEAASLLRAMGAARVPIVDGGSWRERCVQLFIEEPPELLTAFLALGAEPILRILHMRAPLPEHSCLQRDEQ